MRNSAKQTSVPANSDLPSPRSLRSEMKHAERLAAFAGAPDGRVTLADTTVLAHLDKHRWLIRAQR